MDPNHMKFLEEDEVETMHSGADVDAFTSQLNGANSQHISDSAHTASQFIPQWQTFATDGIASFQSGQDVMATEQQANQQSNDQKTLPAGTGNQPTTIGNQDMTALNQQHTGMGMNSQQSTISGTGSLQQPGGASMRNKPVPFGMLLPIILPQLDKDSAMQLQTLYLKLKKNEIKKDDFIRRMRSIVDDQMLKMAVYELQTQAAKQQSVNRFQPQNQPPARQPQVPSTGTNLSLQMPTNLTNSTRDINKMESKADLQGAEGSQMPTSTLNAFNQDRCILAKEGHLELQSILAKIDSFKM